jgi:hypothetical protein
LVAYALPSDFIYFLDLRSPILDAFFFTASVGRLSLAAIEAVGLFGKSFLSWLMSAFVQSPFTDFFFFAILCFLSLHCYTSKVVYFFDYVTSFYNLWMNFQDVKNFWKNNVKKVRIYLPAGEACFLRHVVYNGDCPSGDCH